MAYLLDANVLITAHRQWYGFDFVPGFWSWIKQAHAANLVSSIARVRDELAGDDALAAWVQQLPGSFFVRESASDGAAFQRVAAWAQSQQYQASAVLTFLQGADFGLVAQALYAGPHRRRCLPVGAQPSLRLRSKGFTDQGV